jgi:AcrR family transcriptional regulator
MSRKRLENLALKKDSIISEALKLLDEDGLEGLTLRKLADRLGVQAPALYWHFKNKGALVDEVAELILRQRFEAFHKRAKDQSWKAWLMAAMELLREAMLAHNDGGRVVAGAHLYPAMTLGNIIETSLISLSEAGLPLRRAHQIVMTAMHYTFGHVIEDQSSPSMDDFGDPELSVFRTYFPTSAAAVVAERKAGVTDHDMYVNGLRLIIYGSESLVEDS